jgi:hypothetical protein
MTIQYKYACSECSHEYIEQRAKTEPQYFTKCNSCGNGDYVETVQLFQYAAIDENDKIVSVVFADTQNAAEDIAQLECVKLSEDTQVGATYDRKKKVFI